jgi:hypothetical protein
MRNTLVVVSPGAIRARGFERGTEYQAVARLGEALVGVTDTGRFVVLGVAP